MIHIGPVKFDGYKYSLQLNRSGRPKRGRGYVSRSLTTVLACPPRSLLTSSGAVSTWSSRPDPRVRPAPGCPWSVPCVRRWAVR
jgi:hypothetical protein